MHWPNGADLFRCQAVDVTQGDDRTLPLGQLSQAVFQLAAAFASQRLLLGRARPGPRLTKRSPVPWPLIIGASETIRINQRAIIVGWPERGQRHRAPL